MAATSYFSASILNPFNIIRKGLDRAIREKALKLHGKLLDFGCGSKPYRSFFDVDEYVGLDYENEGHPHINEQIDVFYNGKTIPFENEYFDSALCTEVFEHVFNLEEILVELHRVLKPGGKILITCPFVWNEHEVPYDYARYSRFALNHLLHKHGYEILEFTKTGHFVSSLCQLWILYFYTLLHQKLSRHFITRIIYKSLFVAVPNIISSVIIAVLPKNDSLYLNNVILAKKVENGGIK